MRSLATLAAICLALPVQAGTGTVDAGRGPVQVHIPAGYDPAAPTPLVLLLHALGQTGPSQEAYFRLAPLVDTFGFLYATPNGTQWPGGGAHFWNATDACCDHFGSGVDDVGYLIALIDAIRAEYNVDGTRVYLVGHSNGGFMAYRMACEHPDRFAAIVSLAGATWDDPADCVNAAPVHVLQIHGTNDGVIQYGGGVLAPGGPYPSALETVEYWASVAACSPMPDTSPMPLDVDSGIPGAETTIARYATSCDPDGSAELWTIQGGGHNPQLSPEFPRLVIEYCLAHPKTCGTVVRNCTPVPNSTGLPALMGWSGSISVSANDLVLTAGPIPPFHSAVFIYSPDVVELPLGNGVLCVGTDTLGFVVRMFPVFSDALGTASIAVDYPSPTTSQGQIYSGSSWNFSCWYRDPAAGGSFFNFADGLHILFCP